MKFRKTPLALASFALFAGAPIAAHAVTVSFSEPQVNEVLTNVSYSGSNQCQVSGTDIRRVVFSITSSSGVTTALNTELNSPFNCTLNSRNFADGNYTLRAVAYDASNRTATATRAIVIRNNTSTGGGTTTNPPPVVSFTKPANNTNVAVGSAVSCQVSASDADGIASVQWYLDGALLNTEKVSPYDTCNIYNIAAGTHVIKAVATDSKGAKGEAQITVTAGTSTGGGSTTNPAPVVSFMKPANNITVAVGSAVSCQVSATDTDGIAQVQWFLDGNLINTEKLSPYDTCNVSNLAAGTHVIKAVATDTKGATGEAQITVTAGTSTGGGTGGGSGTPGTGTTLPSSNAKAINTFESIGLYWTPPANPGAAGCTVRYRKKSESSWKEAMPMWYDARNNECRGSIVHVAPGTDYAVEMGLPGQAPSVGVNTKTWSDSFPIAKTIQVASGTSQLNITEGGSPSGYVLYTGPATLDGQNSALHNISVSAPYVIIRGLTLKGAKSHAIRLNPGAHDIVIEDNDISGWGLPDPNGYTTAEGWKVGKDGESAVKANCTSTWQLERTIIQRNKIHHPRYGSNSWSEGHPRGPNGAHYHECGGNHVFRYNEIFSETGRYFMDGFGGAENFGTKGMPNADSDVYGNIILHAWDDGIEAEGANRNVRVWGNYMDNTMTAVASTSVSVGPIYIFRNVWNRARTYSNRTLDNDQRNYMFKSGDNTTYGKGRRYILHNTMLQATQAGTTYPLGGGSGIAGPTSSSPLSNTVSRNNVFHIWKNWWSAFDTKGGTDNDLDYDVSNSSLTANTYAGAETHGITGTPVYAAGHGWQNEAGGNYQLAPSSPGYDKGARLPNFNDGFGGAAPDMGAHEAGTPPMRLGIGGSGSIWSSVGSSDSTAGGTGGTGGGLCSTITCAAQ